MCSSDDSCWPWAVPQISYKYSFTYFHPLTLFQGLLLQLEPIQELVEQRVQKKKKKGLKIMSATNQNIQLKSYSCNVRTKTGVIAFFDIDMRKHVFSAQRGARRVREWERQNKRQSTIEGGMNAKKKLSTPSGSTRLWRHWGRNYCETRASENSHQAAISHVVTWLWYDRYLLLTPRAALPRRLKMIGEGGKASSREIMIFGCSLWASPH